MDDKVLLENEKKEEEEAKQEQEKAEKTTAAVKKKNKYPYSTLAEVKSKLKAMKRIAEAKWKVVKRNSRKVHAQEDAANAGKVEDVAKSVQILAENVSEIGNTLSDKNSSDKIVLIST